MGYLLDCCRGSCCRTCRSGWFSIFWINFKTLVLCACFTTECGSPGIRKPGIRKYMSASLTIIDSWLLSWSATELSILSKRFISNVERFAFMSRTCLRTVWDIDHVMHDKKLNRLLLCLFNVEILCLQMNSLGLYLFQKRSLRSFWRNSSSWKEIIDLLRKERFPSILHSSRVILNNGSLRSVTTWTQNWLLRLETSRQLPNFWLLSVFWTRFPLPFVFQRDLFSGGRGDIYTFSLKSSPVSIVTTFGNNMLEVFLEGCLHSIESDRISILWQQQDWCRPNFSAS